MKIRELKIEDKLNWINLVKSADNRDKEWAKQKFDSFLA